MIKGGVSVCERDLSCRDEAPQDFGCCSLVAVDWELNRQVSWATLSAMIELALSLRKA